MPHPNFLGPGEGASQWLRRPAVLQPNHASARLGFRSAPSLGLEHDFQPDRGVPVESVPASLGTWSVRV